MPSRLKRLVGMIVLVVFVLFYVIIAIDVGNVIVATKSGTVQMIYFSIAGLAWVLPAGLIIWLTYRMPRRP